MILDAILIVTLAHSEAACKPNPAKALGKPVTKFASNIGAMMHARNGDYWLSGAADGVYRYDGKTITQFTTDDGLPHNDVRHIQQDKRGNLYFTTGGGIAKYDGKTFSKLEQVMMDAPDKGWRLNPDDLWFAFGPNDGGPSRYDGKKLYILRFPKHPLDDGKKVYLPDPGTNLFGVTTMYKDSKGNMWFGTGDKGLCRYDGKTINWLYEDHLTNVPEGGSFGIRSIIEDRDGKFWICNTRSRFEPASKNLPAHGWLPYKALPGTGDLTSMIGEEKLYFQSVVRGKEGDLWLMPWAGGIFRYNGKKVTHYPVKNGAEDAYMTSIYKDRNGDLWICSQTTGPFKFDGKSFVKFDWQRRVP